ncbi:MAG: hypothetical protein WC459_05115 [Patescibacteria group bacterium]
MPEKNDLKWQIPEYPQYHRGKLWYLCAALIGVLLMIYAIISGNFLFTIIIIISVLISLISSWRDPKMIDFKLTEDGVIIDGLFYSWDKFQGYWMVKNEEVNNLGLDLKNWLKTDLYVPVNGVSLEAVEKFVSKFLKKNLDRKEEPLSYLLGRKLKI